MPGYHNNERITCIEAGRHILYDCEICGGLHPWSFTGDCREDANRYPDDETYARYHGLTSPDLIEVRLMNERVEADTAPPPPPQPWRVASGRSKSHGDGTCHTLWRVLHERFGHITEARTKSGVVWCSPHLEAAKRLADRLNADESLADSPK